MKSVSEITNLVQEWVQEIGSKTPGFRGAYLFGGIAGLADEALRPDYLDVDLIVVVTGKMRPQEENLELDYKGVLLEVGFWGTEDHSSAEAILSNPALASNFAGTKILADPGNWLAPLQHTVKSEFPRRKWVAARCEAEKERIHENVESIRLANSPDARGMALWEWLNNLSGLLALASLRKPTHRRSLTLMKEILAQQGRLDLHEEALRIWGVGGMSRQRVQAVLDESLVLFDRALEIKRSPSMLDFKLRPHLRPYFCEANQEMIDEGNHREAMFWIIVGYSIAAQVVINDGGEDEKRSAAGNWAHLNEEMSPDGPEGWPRQLKAINELTGKILALADQMVAQNPND